jgi:hypothetical protein
MGTASCNRPSSSVCSRAPQILAGGFCGDATAEESPIFGACDRSRGSVPGGNAPSVRYLLGKTTYLLQESLSQQEIRSPIAQRCLHLGKRCVWLAHRRMPTTPRTGLRPSDLRAEAGGNVAEKYAQLLGTPRGSPTPRPYSTTRPPARKLSLVGRA